MATATRDADDRLMTTEQVAELLAVPTTTLRVWRSRGDVGPKSQRIGQRAVRYWRSDVMAWINQGIELEENR